MKQSIFFAANREAVRMYEDAKKLGKMPKKWMECSERKGDSYYLNAKKYERDYAMLCIEHEELTFDLANEAKENGINF